MHAEHGSCLLRALSPREGWESQTAKVSNVTAWLKQFFVNGPCNVTSRSLKLSVLVWAARHGISRSDRRTCGYHVKSKDRQVTIYFRDELSVPLRALKKIYADIIEGNLIPDETARAAPRNRGKKSLPFHTLGIYESFSHNFISGTLWFEEIDRSVLKRLIGQWGTVPKRMRFC